MSVSLTWVIEYMTVSPQPISGENQVVINAGWRCNGTEGNLSSSIYGTSSFPEPSTGGQFTPYAQLTQDQVLGWCYANGVNQSEIEASVTQAVNDLANTSVTNPPLPWAAQSAI